MTKVLDHDFYCEGRRRRANWRRRRDDVCRIAANFVDLAELSLLVAS